MSLNFNYANVADKDVVCTDPNNAEKYHPVFDALIWLSMICGYNKITEDNCAKVYTRIAQYQAVVGAYLGYAGEDGKRVPLYITLEDVRRYIGMQTNVTAETDSQWNKRLAVLALEEASRKAHKQGTSAYDTVQRLHDEKVKEAA
jgi:hypothetical protein